MFEIKLTHDEAEMLRKILEFYLSDLRVEIAGTDLVDFRDTLKKEELFIKDLLHRLEAVGVNVSS